MGVFTRLGWRSHEVVEPGAPKHARTMRASGMRVDPSVDNGSNRLRAVAQARQRWQSLAWQYRDSIPELRFATGPGIRHLIGGTLTPAQAVRQDVVTILKGNLKLLTRFTERFRIDT